MSWQLLALGNFLVSLALEQCPSLGASAHGVRLQQAVFAVGLPVGLPEPPSGLQCPQSVLPDPGPCSPFRGVTVLSQPKGFSNPALPPPPFTSPGASKWVTLVQALAVRLLRPLLESCCCLRPSLLPRLPHRCGACTCPRLTLHLLLEPLRPHGASPRPLFCA